MKQLPESLRTRREVLTSASLGAAAAVTAVIPTVALEELLSAEQATTNGRASMGTLQQLVKYRPYRDVPASAQQWKNEQGESLRRRLHRDFGLDVMRAEINRPVQVEQLGQPIEPEGWHYRIRRLKLSGVYGTELPVNVYEPTRGSRALAGFVYVTGHINPSKEWPEGQQLCANLAERGVVAVAMDYFGFGERAQPGNGHAVGTFSYTKLTATGLEVSDGMRAVSYLLARGDVDPKRIGFTGWSGGGHFSHWIGAVDDRITLVVPCVGTCDFPTMWIGRSLDSKFAERNECWHMHMPGFRGHSDMGLAFALVYPGRLRIINEQGDVTFSRENAEPLIERAQKIYALFGKPDRVDLRCPNPEHNYDAKKQEQLYEVVNDEFFAGKHELGTEVLKTPELSPDKLRVGIDTSRTYATAYADRIRQLPPSVVRAVPENRAEARQRAVMLREDVRKLLAVDLQPYASQIQRDDEVKTKDGLRIRPGRITTESFGDKQLAIHFWEMFRATTAEIPRLLLVGSPETATYSSLMVAALAENFRLLFIQPRDDSQMRNALQRYGIFYGRPALGMKVQDVHRAADALLPSGSTAGIVGIAEGRSPWRTGDVGEIALFATLLSPRLDRATVRLSLLSYKAEALADPFASDYATIPGVLEVGDLAQFLWAAAPNPVQLISPVNSQPADVQSHYAWVHNSLRIAYPQQSSRRYFLQRDRIDAAAITSWHR